MRYVAALFDAPIPARTALVELVSRGFAPEDVIAIPAPPGATWSGRPSWRPPGDERSLAPGLAALGIPPATAEAYAEGIRRGAILVIARCPTLSAPMAASILAASPVVDLSAALRRWQMEPGLRYDWAALPPPEIAP